MIVRTKIKTSVSSEGSDEELKDLKEVYKEHEGDMDAIIDHMMCASFDDEDRYRY